MRWDSSSPTGSSSMRFEGIVQANFWKDAFLTGRAIAPGDAVFEWNVFAWKRCRKGKEAQIRDHHTRAGAVRHGGGLEALEEFQDGPVGAYLRHPYWRPNELVARVHDRMTTHSWSRATMKNT